jgi:GNAT superfamily N-acetyltransferase
VRGPRDGGEYEEMLTVVARGFGHPVDAVRRRFERHPPYKLEGSRVVFVDGRMVSVVHVHELQVRSRGGSLRLSWDAMPRVSLLPGATSAAGASWPEETEPPWLLGGVGEVATLPEHRHQGYATLALRDAIGYMEGLGCRFSMLFTGQQPFYERLGWRPYPIAYLTFDPQKTVLPKGRANVTIREMDWEPDLPALERIYQEYNRDKVGPLLRTEAYWREATSPRRRSGSSWTALRRKEPVAYLWGAAELRILELPHLPEEEAAARALLLHALRVAQKESFKQVVLSEPCVPIACELADRQPPGAVTRAVYRNMMLRPIAPGSSTDFAPGELVYYGTDSF